MQKLTLSKFKAFEDEITLSLDGKNLLLYGENGAGKSSVYESIKTVFFKDRLEGHISASTPEEKEQLIANFWSRYNNKIQNQGFQIKVNDIEYGIFDSTSFQAFLISLQELKFPNRIYLKELLNGFFFKIDDVEKLCEDGFTTLQEEVNTILKTFNESVSIEISEEDNYSIKIIDSTKNIESKQEIVTYFNEAKINLICILILLNVILLAKKNGKKQILVLDDFITSLDSSNRTYLIKYIFEKFADFQIFILTHNISFYNLTMFMINKINEQQNFWTFANLYEIANKHKIYQKPGMETVAIIKTDYLQPVASGTTIDIEGIGNRLRKKFEVFLYEFSKLLQIGAVEDSNNIIDRILNDKAAYYYDSKTAMDLIDDLEYILNHHNQYNLAGRLKNKINIYKRSDFGNFKQIVKNLKLYQKVTLHPMSHGVTGMATFTTKEIEESIALLEKMEGFLKDMIDKNVYTI